MEKLALKFEEELKEKSFFAKKECRYNRDTFHNSSLVVIWDNFLIISIVPLRYTLLMRIYISNL